MTQNRQIQGLIAYPTGPTHYDEAYSRMDALMNQFYIDHKYQGFIRAAQN